MRRGRALLISALLSLNTFMEACEVGGSPARHFFSLSSWAIMGAIPCQRRCLEDGRLERVPRDVTISVDLLRATGNREVAACSAASPRSPLSAGAAIPAPVMKKRQRSEPAKALPT